MKALYVRFSSSFHFVLDLVPFGIEVFQKGVFGAYRDERAPHVLLYDHPSAWWGRARIPNRICSCRNQEDEIAKLFFLSWLVSSSRSA
jgi:hypothetical protein